jgi:hypothetical protein
VPLSPLALYPAQLHTGNGLLPACHTRWHYSPRQAASIYASLLHQAATQPHPIELGADLSLTGDLTPFRLAISGEGFHVFGGCLPSPEIEARMKAGHAVGSGTVGRWVSQFGDGLKGRWWLWVAATGDDGEVIIASGVGSHWSTAPVASETLPWRGEAVARWEVAARWWTGGLLEGTGSKQLIGNLRMQAHRQLIPCFCSPLSSELS